MNRLQLLRKVKGIPAQTAMVAGVALTAALMLAFALLLAPEQERAHAQTPASPTPTETSTPTPTPVTVTISMGSDKEKFEDTRHGHPDLPVQINGTPVPGIHALVFDVTLDQPTTRTVSVDYKVVGSGTNPATEAPPPGPDDPNTLDIDESTILPTNFVDGRFTHTPDFRVGATHTVELTGLSDPRDNCPDPQGLLFYNVDENGVLTPRCGEPGTHPVVVFAPGETSQVITVWVFHDEIWEPEEEFTVTLLQTRSYYARLTTNADDLSAKGTIKNDDPIPTLGIYRQRSELPVLESGDSDTTHDAAAVISLRPGPPQDNTAVTVNIGGTATIGTDYTLTVNRPSNGFERGAISGGTSFMTHVLRNNADKGRLHVGVIVLQAATVGETIELTLQSGSGYNLDPEATTRTITFVAATAVQDLGLNGQDFGLNGQDSEFPVQESEDVKPPRKPSPLEIKIQALIDAAVSENDRSMEMLWTYALAAVRGEDPPYHGRLPL